MQNRVPAFFTRFSLSIYLVCLCSGCFFPGWAEPTSTPSDDSLFRSNLFTSWKTSSISLKPSQIEDILAKISMLRRPDGFSNEIPDSTITLDQVIQATLTHHADIKSSCEKIHEMELKREYMEAKRVLFFFNYFDTTLLEGSSENDVTAASAHHQSVIQQTLLDTLDRYFNLMRAYFSQAVAYQEIQLTKSQLREAEGLFKSGQVTQVTVAQNEVKLIQNLQDYLVASKNIETLYFTLSSAIHLPNTPVLRPAEMNWPFPESSQTAETPDAFEMTLPKLHFFQTDSFSASDETLIKLAVDHRPDLKEIRLKQLSMETLYKLTKAKFQETQEKIVHSNLKQIEFKVEQLSQAIKSGVINQKNDWLLKNHQLILSEAQYQLAKQSLDQVKKAHQKGFSSNPDVLEAQTALAKATHQLANRVLDESLAQLKLLYQLGLLTPETLLKGDVKL
jgi:hypothetical protein